MYCLQCGIVLPDTANFCLQCGTPQRPVRKPIPQKLRFEVFKRDEFTCQYCGRKPPAVTLEVDHRVPVSKGGSNHADNLVTSCEECNGGKGAEPLTDAVDTKWLEAQERRAKEVQLTQYRKTLANVRRIQARADKMVREYRRLRNVEERAHGAEWGASDPFVTFAGTGLRLLAGFAEEFEAEKQLVWNPEEHAALSAAIEAIEAEKSQIETELANLEAERLTKTRRARARTKLRLSRVNQLIREWKRTRQKEAAAYMSAHHKMLSKSNELYAFSTRYVEALNGLRIELEVEKQRSLNADELFELDGAIRVLESEVSQIESEVANLKATRLARRKRRSEVPA